MDIDTTAQVERAIFRSRTTIYFLFAIVFVALFGTAGVVGIIHWAEAAERTALISTLLGFLAPTLIGLMAIIKIQEGVERTKATYGLVDGQMTEFKRVLMDLADVKEQLARGIGVSEGVAQHTATVKLERSENVAGVTAAREVVHTAAVTAADTIVETAKIAAEKLAAAQIAAAESAGPPRSGYVTGVVAAHEVVHTAAVTAADTIVETAKLAAEQLAAAQLAAAGFDVPPRRGHDPLRAAGETETALALEVTGTLRAESEKSRDAKKPNGEHDKS